MKWRLSHKWEWILKELFSGYILSDMGRLIHQRKVANENMYDLWALPSSLPGTHVIGRWWTFNTNQTTSTLMHVFNSFWSLLPSFPQCFSCSTSPSNWFCPVNSSDFSAAFNPQLCPFPFCPYLLHNYNSAVPLPSRIGHFSHPILSFPRCGFLLTLARAGAEMAILSTSRGNSKLPISSVIFVFFFWPSSLELFPLLSALRLANFFKGNILTRSGGSSSALEEALALDHHVYLLRLNPISLHIPCHYSLEHLHAVWESICLRGEIQSACAWTCWK